MARPERLREGVEMEWDALVLKDSRDADHRRHSRDMGRLQVVVLMTQIL